MNNYEKKKTNNTNNQAIHQTFKKELSSSYLLLQYVIDFGGSSSIEALEAGRMVGTWREINGGWRLEIGTSPTMSRSLDRITAKEAVVATAGGGVVGEAAVNILGFLLLHGVDKERYQSFHFSSERWRRWFYWIIWFFKYWWDAIYFWWRWSMDYI